MVISRVTFSGEKIPLQIKLDSPRLEESRGKVREIKYDHPPKQPVRLSVHSKAMPMMRDGCGARPAERMVELSRGSGRLQRRVLELLGETPGRKRSRLELDKVL